MGRSMTDIEDVRSAAQLFSNLQSQAEQPHLPNQLHQPARRGLLAQLHLLQGPSYPASYALLVHAWRTEATLSPGMACLQLAVHDTRHVPALVMAALGPEGRCKEAISWYEILKHGK